MKLAIGTLDLTIILVYLAGVVALGMWVGRKQRGLSDFLLGGRSLPWWAVLGSIVATETSTATFLSIPGIAYALDGDLRLLQLTFGYILGRWIIAVVLLPRYLEGNIYSVYELLRDRFGGATQKTASVMFLVARNLGDGLRLYLTAIALHKVVDLSLTTSVIVIGVCTVVYTSIGGMKSVVWNDCLQFVVYTVGGAVALWLIVDRLPDGWHELRTFAVANDKFRVFDWSFDLTASYTIWSGVIGGMFLTLGTHGTDQMMVQRYLCARSSGDARAALVLSGFVVCLQFALFLILGIALACFYQHPPEAPFDKTDHVFAEFIVEHLPPGFVGLILAAVFAAAMSTLSSSLNSSAAAAVNDFLRKPEDRGAADQDSPRLLTLSRLLTVAFAVVQIVIGIGAQYLDSNVVTNALSIAGFTAGVLLGVFVLALPQMPIRVGQRSVLVAMLTGVTAVGLVKFGTPIAWPWFAVIGAAVTFTTGILVERLLGGSQP